MQLRYKGTLTPLVFPKNWSEFLYQADWGRQRKGYQRYQLYLFSWIITLIQFRSSLQSNRLIFNIQPRNKSESATNVILALIFPSLTLWSGN